MKQSLQKSVHVFANGLLILSVAVFVVSCVVYYKHVKIKTHELRIEPRDTTDETKIIHENDGQDTTQEL